MTRAVVDASRLVAVHARGAASLLATEFPDRPITYLPLGMGRAEVTPEATRARTRASWRVATDAVVFGLFGGLSVEKRVEPVLRSFARRSGVTRAPGWCLRARRLPSSIRGPSPPHSALPSR